VERDKRGRCKRILGRIFGGRHDVNLVLSRGGMCRWCHERTGKQIDADPAYCEVIERQVSEGTRTSAIDDGSETNGRMRA